jgi:hypothetical protein
MLEKITDGSQGKWKYPAWKYTARKKRVKCGNVQICLVPLHKGECF